MLRGKWTFFKRPRLPYIQTLKIPFGPKSVIMEFAILGNIHFVFSKFGGFQVAADPSPPRTAPNHPQNTL